MKKITPEDVERFLNGHDPMERIISIECGYDDNTASIIYVNENGDKRVKRENFYPFVWVKNSACQRMFGGDRSLFVRKLRQYGIKIKALQTQGDDGSVSSRLDEGYKFLFYSYRKMSYKVFMMFFQESGVPIYERKKKNDDAIGGSKEFMACSPVEQFMISTGKRLFKGYDNYDDLKRTTFDLETEGLNAKYHMISQIGYRNNKGFQKIINITGDKEEKWKSEMAAIEEFVRILSEDKPDNVAGHNSENFDWDFIINRCKEHGVDFSELSAKYLNRHPIFKKKKQTVLKLGGEMEYYYPTIMWGTNIIDSMHAARRAQALDSSMKSSNLKYVTKYLGLNKQNRVYVPGDIINQTWAVTDEVYAFNDDNGDWYKVTDSKPLRDGYVLKSGKYIVERYLYDDLWETDKVELKLNESNFLVGKMIPTSFSRTCTMGTAGVWKLIMLAWCYENELAIPSTTSNRKFTGGLSRLLITGYVSRIVKLDFNSLYPSIILTWNISTSLDVMNIMLYLLEYILTQREKYKDLKNQAGSKADEIKDEIANATGLSEDEINKMLEAVRYWKAEKIGNDKKQLPLKVLGNGFFGSYGCPMVFPFGDIDAAEKTTCIGRMSLRLMISHFTNIGYTPVVGDSFTGDTPIFIKYDNSGLIDIVPIEGIINKDEIQIDALGREYDTSKKSFKVLCHSGWVEPSYIYRHKTSKDIYRVTDSNTLIDVTEDHSLYNKEGNKIKPSEVNSKTDLEYYIFNDYTDNRSVTNISLKYIERIVHLIESNSLTKLPIKIINMDKKSYELFNKFFNNYGLDMICSKSVKAGLLFLYKRYNGL